MFSWEIDAYLKTLISPQMVVSLDTSPISIKYLQSWTCTTAAKYQQIWEKKYKGDIDRGKDVYSPPQEDAALKCQARSHTADSML